MDIKRKNKAGQEVKVGEYVTVNQRIKAFHELYPKGKIVTEIIKIEPELAVMKATVTPNVEDESRYFNGFAQERPSYGWINKTDCLENCETSAVGRALGFLGIGIDQAIATVEDIKSAMKAYEGIDTFTAKGEDVPMPKAKETTAPPKQEVVPPILDDQEKTEAEDVETEESKPEPLKAHEMADQVISDEQIGKIKNLTTNHGYTYKEIIEIIGHLGYKTVKSVLMQDFDDIMASFGKTAKEWREKKAEIKNEASWDE